VLVATVLAILATMGMALVRALLGPTVYDRILAVNMFGTKTMLLIAVLGFLAGRPDFLDIALLYALISFVGNVAVVRFVRYENFRRARQDRVQPHGRPGVIR